MALNGTFEEHPISGSGFGLYCEWSGTQNKVSNYTDITLKVYACYTSLSISERSGTITIDGTATSYTSPAISQPTPTTTITRKLIGQTTTRVNHNSDGTKSATLKAKWNCDIHDYAGQAVESVTAQTTVTITAIDRSAPTVDLTVTDVSSSSATFMVTSSQTADKWDYKVNGGSWTTFSEYEGTSAVVTIDLEPNTGYDVQARARRKLNHVYGTSSVVEVDTLGGSIISGASAVTINAPGPKVTYSVTCYDATYTHTLTVKVGNTTIVSLNNLRFLAGTTTKTLNFLASHVTAIMNALPNSSSGTLTYTLTSYSNGVQMGNVSVTTGNVYISEAASPTFTGASTFRDAQQSVVAVTGNSSALVQLVSRLRVVCNSATAKTGASIVSYSVTIGEKTESSSTTTVNFGAIDDLSGEVQAYVSAVDSRGFATTVAHTIIVIPYEPVSITAWSAARQNSADAAIDISFGGHKSSVVVGSVEKNPSVTADYRYKQATAADYGSPVSISGVTVTGETFEYTGTPVSLNVDYAYHIKVTVSDAFTSSSVTMYVNKGKPLMSFRSEKVGILTNQPQSALDVNGIIRMNGQNVMGVVNDSLGANDDLNTITETGLYFNNSTAGTTANHYPAANLNGMLEVMNSASGYVIFQRYTNRVNGDVYVRTKVLNNWTSWSAH